MPEQKQHCIVTSPQVEIKEKKSLWGACHVAQH